MIVAMIAIFYFMLIRPQKKKDKEIKQMRESVAVGDDIVTIGGINGKVVKVSDDIIVIELPHAKQRITFAKWAIGTVEKKSKDSKVEEKNSKEAKEIEANIEEKTDDKKEK
ncbi:preprotein translocase subunit YajC [Sedimentibacter sp. zth1]|nr:preprotein translocase subunit YajC [Sedimentibacter sp. zth1]QSX07291.1 preprotein translocase subunit YajC [Sedimentibacter sp. zth1]